MADSKLEGLKIRAKKILGYVIWILIAFFIISTVKNINRIISIRKQIENERAVISKIEADNAKLQAQINEAQGTDYIEKQIRNKLGLTKAGEAMVILPDESVVRSFAPPKAIDTETLPDPNWKKWEKLFF